MSPQDAERGTPRFIPIHEVADVGSAIMLDRERLRLLVIHEPPGHRLNELLHLPVVSGSGRALGRVLDVRLTRNGDIDGLIVGRGGPGSLLGYDRRRDQGPWLVGTVIRWLHRGAGYRRTVRHRGYRLGHPDHPDNGRTRRAHRRRRLSGAAERRLVRTFSVGTSMPLAAGSASPRCARGREHGLGGRPVRDTPRVVCAAEECLSRGDSVPFLATGAAGRQPVRSSIQARTDRPSVSGCPSGPVTSS